jgi:hypothetical protein
MVPVVCPNTDFEPLGKIDLSNGSEKVEEERHNRTMAG